VLERLHHGPLTQLQAYSEIGTTRLAARVEELRRAGHVINTAMVCTKNGKSFAAYSLIKEKL
jgi:hypothetical protein